MDEKKTEVLKDANTSEMGTATVVEEAPKKKKTNLITPIISIVLGAAAWISTFASNQIENFKGLIGTLTGNQEMFNTAQSELGEVSGASSNFWDLVQNYGLTILLVVILIAFTIIGIVGICKLITRICRRTKNKFVKD